MIGPNQARLAVNGRYSGTDHGTVQRNLYMRKFQQGSLLFNMLFRSDWVSLSTAPI
jgi:hypothetical protein